MPILDALYRVDVITNFSNGYHNSYIVLFVLSGLRKAYTAPPQDTTNPDNSQTPGGGNVANPGNAIDYAPTPTSSTNPLVGILLMVAVIVGDFLSRKLEDLAEEERERQRRISEEKERQMNANEEKARDERRRILQDELSSEDSNVRERAREELKRQLDASDERGRVERDRLITDLLILTNPCGPEPRRSSTDR